MTRIAPRQSTLWQARGWLGRSARRARGRSCIPPRRTLRPGTAASRVLRHEGRPSALLLHHLAHQDPCRCTSTTDHLAKRAPRARGARSRFRNRRPKGACTEPTRADRGRACSRRRKASDARPVVVRERVVVGRPADVLAAREPHGSSGVLMACKKAWANPERRPAGNQSVHRRDERPKNRDSRVGAPQPRGPLSMR